MTEAKKISYQNRRSVYALGKSLPVSEQESVRNLLIMLLNTHQVHLTHKLHML